MPIYEYRCERCGHEMETMQKMNEPALTTCPQCKQEALRKLISAAGFQLKGAGWYATDFKDKGKKPEAKSDKGADSSAPACGQGACPACTDD